MFFFFKELGLLTNLCFSLLLMTKIYILLVLIRPLMINDNNLQYWYAIHFHLAFVYPTVFKNTHQDCIFFPTDSLLIDYQFTFSLLQEDDRHYTAINFIANPEQVRRWFNFYNIIIFISSATKLSSFIVILPLIIITQ